MPNEWKAWCRAESDLTVRGDVVEVKLPDSRSHRVTVESGDDGLTLTARIATRGAMANVDDAELLVWERNRATQLVGFRIDKLDLLIGEAWVPAAGLTAAELVFYVRHLAAECDRLEALLTGLDVE